ncbi:ATP-binding protein [Embleya sp. MST-111070]|uniref:ATP-binding protein n=1 Tax=Embleya sp. MST-111070 TaxID=3398231 RepID=UPI003F73670B
MTEAPPEPLLTLPLSIHAPRQARRHIATVCLVTGLDPDVTDVVLLVVSELVTNVLRHVGHGSVTLAWELRADRLIIDVGDEAPDEFPELRTAEDDAEAGRGLRLVLAFTDQYAVIRVEGSAPQPPRKITRVAFLCPAAGHRNVDASITAQTTPSIDVSDHRRSTVVDDPNPDPPATSGWFAVAAPRPENLAPARVSRTAVLRTGVAGVLGPRPCPCMPFGVLAGGPSSGGGRLDSRRPAHRARANGGGA